MAVRVDFLRSVAYFDGLGQAELEAIGQHIFERQAGRGETLVFEGEPAEALYIVAEGAVKVFKTSADGKEQILRIVRPGESFNDVSVFGGGTSLASAEALGPVVLNVLRKSDLELVLRDYPPVAANALRVLAQRAKHLVELIEDLSFRNVTSRVAKVLLEHAGDSTGERPRLTQQQMAAMIGTAREMVGRSLKVLEEEGAISIERHRIVITSRAALQNMAGVAN